MMDYPLEIEQGMLAAQAGHNDRILKCYLPLVRADTAAKAPWVLAAQIRLQNIHQRVEGICHHAELQMAQEGTSNWERQRS
jgi:hypothetical protein